MALPIAIDWHDGTIVGLNTGCSKGPPDVIHGCWVDPAYFYP